MAHLNNDLLISKVLLPDGNTYEIHDAEAIHELADLGLQGYLVFRGTVANFAALPTGAAVGDVYHVIDEDQEYIWVDAVEGGEAAHWEAFGNHILLDHTHEFEATTVTITGTNEASAISGNANVIGGNESSAVEASGKITVPDLSKEARYIKLSSDAIKSVTVSDEKGAFITGFGTHTTADAITELETATLKNPTVNEVSVPNVTGNAAVTASKISKNDIITASKISANDNVSASKITDNSDVTASKVTTTAGSAAQWSASVSGGVLSFNFVANVPTAVEAKDVTASKISATDVTASKITASDVEASKITAESVEASKVTLGAELAVSKVTTQDVTVASGIKNTAKAITGLGAATTAEALTKVTASTEAAKVELAEGSNLDGVYAGDSVAKSDKEINVAVTGTAAAQKWTMTSAEVTGTAAAQIWTQTSGTVSGTTGAPIESN
jgi:hypothetical protein